MGKALPRIMVPKAMYDDAVALGAIDPGDPSGAPVETITALEMEPFFTPNMSLNYGMICREVEKLPSTGVTRTQVIK